METMVGVVEKVVYDTEASDYKVFLLRRKDRSCIRITGEFANLVLGAKIEVHGDYKTHPKYGVNFNSSSHTYSYENNTTSIILYLQAIAKWIGPERSAALAAHFKENLQDVIENTPEKLVEVEGIGEKVAQSLVEAWELNKNLKDIQIFLHGLGLSALKIKRILTNYGMESERILKENPWLLCFNGFGFSSCDYIAFKLDKQPDDPLRYKWYILYALRECLTGGHLFLYPSQLLDLFNKYNKKSPNPFKEGEITVEDIAVHVKNLTDEGYITRDNGRIYEITSFFYENESARLLSEVAKSTDTCKLNQVNIEEFIENYEKDLNLKLSPAQKEAIRIFSTEKVLVITGCPGTGKTTIVRAFVQLMKKLNLSFELLTPTGIAAKKLGTTAGCDAYTIHRRLGFKGVSWNNNSLNKYDTQVVIVDESSMVDQEVFYRLISALHKKTKLVFVGDNDQLPSVGPGSVLRELIDSKLIKTVYLDTIFRQEECSDIIKEAKKIRDGDIDLSLFKQDKMADIWHIRESDSDKIQDIIIRFASQLKDSNKVREEKKYFQILTPRNEGPLSVDTLNAALQKVLNPPDSEKKEIIVNKQTIRRGDRILIRKNNYELGVFNGDIGKVAHITNAALTVDLEGSISEEHRVEIPLKFAEEMIKLAYAITVHKSQGLEYPLVIIALVKAHGKLLLQRNLLYTALTRAKKKAIILGQASAIESAIQNDKMQKRNTLFGERIKQWMNGGGISLRSMFSSPSSFPNVKILEQLLLLEANG